MVKKGTDAAIDVHGLSFAYGKRRVLRNIGFTIMPGEFVGVLGANGSGKTSLLNCLTGVLKGDRGKVLVCGKDVSTISSIELARMVAVVPQESPMNFAFTVEEVVLMGRYSHIDRFSLEEERDLEVADKAMRATGIFMLRERPVTDLSGGERQRVVIARALTQEPKVLLLDEPTSHLDIRHQLEVLGLIRKLNEARKLTVLAVFHDLNLAARFCDRVILLKDGNIMAVGTPGDVLTGDHIQRAFRVEAIIGRSSAGKVVVEVGGLAEEKGS